MTVLCRLASTQQSARAELFRHFLDAGVDPFEVRRRVARVRVEGLRVLDLTNDVARRFVGITLSELVGDDFASCQRMAQLVRDNGFDAILWTSAALPSNATRVVIDHGIEKVIVELSTITVALPRLA